LITLDCLNICAKIINNFAFCKLFDSFLVISSKNGAENLQNNFLCCIFVTEFKMNNRKLYGYEENLEFSRNHAGDDAGDAGVVMR